MKNPVFSVALVCATRAGVAGRDTLLLAALGQVPTSGWSSPELAGRVYITPPEDGIWDFDFLAQAPAGMAADVVTPILAVQASDAPDWVKGVRVHAANGAIASGVLTVAASSPASLDAKTTASAQWFIVEDGPLGRYFDVEPNLTPDPCSHTYSAFGQIEPVGPKERLCSRVRFLLDGELEPRWGALYIVRNPRP